MIKPTQTSSFAL